MIAKTIYVSEVSGGKYKFTEPMRVLLKEDAISSAKYNVMLDGGKVRLVALGIGEGEVDEWLRKELDFMYVRYVDKLSFVERLFSRRARSIKRWIAENVTRCNYKRIGGNGYE